MTYSAEPTYELWDRVFFRSQPGRKHQVRPVLEEEEFDDALDAAGNPFPEDDETTLFAATRHFRGNILRAYLAVPKEGEDEIMLAARCEDRCREMFESLLEFGVRYRLAKKFDWDRNGETIH